MAAGTRIAHIPVSSLAARFCHLAPTDPLPECGRAQQADHTPERTSAVPGVEQAEDPRHYEQVARLTFPPRYVRRCREVSSRVGTEDQGQERSERSEPDRQYPGPQHAPTKASGTR